MVFSPQFYLLMDEDNVDTSLFSHLLTYLIDITTFENISPQRKDVVVSGGENYFTELLHSERMK